MLGRASMPPNGNMSDHKQRVQGAYERSAGERKYWIKRGAFFYSEDLLYLQFLIPENARVLELGCGTGHLLAALRPSFGVGVDFSEGMITEARRTHGHLTFVTGDAEDEGFVQSLP